MATSDRRRKTLLAKQQAKAGRFAAAGKRRGQSRYARKAKYCQKNGVWGFEVPAPKPW